MQWNAIPGSHVAAARRAFAACLQLVVAAQQPAAPATTGASRPRRRDVAWPAAGRFTCPDPNTPFCQTNETSRTRCSCHRREEDQKAPIDRDAARFGGTHTTMMRPTRSIWRKPAATSCWHRWVQPAWLVRRAGAAGTPVRSAANAAPNAAAPNAASPLRRHRTRPCRTCRAKPDGVGSAGRRGGGRCGANPNDPPNLRELSEKETAAVIELVRKEFHRR